MKLTPQQIDSTAPTACTASPLTAGNAFGYGYGYLFGAGQAESPSTPKPEQGT